VDGCDISPDMLAFCRERAHRQGLTPQLYQQAMHELDLPRKYKTIIVCGGFGLGSKREHHQEALTRFHYHLEPGGALVLDTYLPYKDSDEWQFWTKKGRRNLPEPWPSTGARKCSANGDEYELQCRLVSLDPLDQLVTRQIRALLWQDGQLVRQEDYTLLERLYFRNELLDMLARSGFHNVRVHGDYSHAEATPDNNILIYIATK
jgi:SAM-dependent methyltransferase